MTKKFTPFKGKDTKKVYEGIKKLQKMEYDPIKELVWLARELKEENQYWKDVRSGKLVELTEKGGNKRYSGVAHLGVLTLMGKVGAELLPYKYSKVPQEQIMDVKGGGTFNIIAGSVERNDEKIIDDSDKDDTPKIVPIKPPS